MKITDILTLVKAGYTPTEIGNLERKDDVLQLIQGGAQKDDIDELLSLAGDDPQVGQEPDPAPEPPKEPDPEPEEDYKAKYEELLKKTQLQNQRQPMAPANTKTADEILAEIVTEYI